MENMFILYLENSTFWRHHIKWTRYHLWLGHRPTYCWFGLERQGTWTQFWRRKSSWMRRTWHRCRGHAHADGVTQLLPTVNEVRDIVVVVTRRAPNNPGLGCVKLGSIAPRPRRHDVGSCRCCCARQTPWTCVSSAYRCGHRLFVSTSHSRSDVYTRNRIGPRIPVALHTGRLWDAMLICDSRWTMCSGWGRLYDVNRGVLSGGKPTKCQTDCRPLRLMYSVSRKKETKMLSVISSIKLGRFWWNLVHSFMNKFAAEICKCFLPHLNNFSTLPYETWNPHNPGATTAFSDKETPEFIPSQLWPPNSPDLNPVDYSVWEYCKRRCTKYASLIWMNWNSDWERSGSS